MGIDSNPENDRNKDRATCMVSLSTGSGLSQYKELEAQRQLIGFPSLRSIQNHCPKEKFLSVAFLLGQKGVLV